MMGGMGGMQGEEQAGDVHQEPQEMDSGMMDKMSGMQDMMGQMQDIMAKMMSSGDMSGMDKMHQMMQQMNEIMNEMMNPERKPFNEYDKLPQEKKSEYDRKSVGADKHPMEE